MSPTKELILICAGGIKGVLDVQEHDTLASVRTLIDQELDDDLIIPDFAFHVNSVRISRKQEAKKLAWSVIGKVVSLESKRSRPSLEEDTFCSVEKKKYQQDVVKVVTNDNNDAGGPSQAPVEQVADISRTCSSSSSSSLPPPCKKQRLNHYHVSTTTITSTPTTTCQQETENVDFFVTPVKKAEVVVTPYCADDTVTDEKCRNGHEISTDHSVATSPLHVSKKLNGTFEHQCKKNHNVGHVNHSSVDKKNENDRHCAESSNVSSHHCHDEDDRSEVVEFYADDADVDEDDDVDDNDDDVDDYKDVDSIPYRNDIENATSTLLSKDHTAQCNDHNNHGNDDNDDHDDLETTMTSPCKLDFKETSIEKKADDFNTGESVKEAALELIPCKTDDDQVHALERSKAEIMSDESLDIPDSTKDADRALEISCSVLNSVKTLLEENPLFCSNDRREEWIKEINERLAMSAPKTTVGVLGNTGVGKSSLLNALLDEASVLPTSGSRGCTAAVVELRFNSELLEQKSGNDEMPVYRGIVEFITLEEWRAELQILVEECCTQENTVYVREPDPQTAAEAAAAWAKIDQVYGRGTMYRYRGKKSTYLYDKLSGDFRIVGLLRPKLGTTYPYNTIAVEEGAAIPGSVVAQQLVSSYKNMSTRLQRKKKKWAQSFRSQINSYVYRKGNGDEPQTWPLIRKVVLFGPWACLSTGACLVDLPGVRDANAARAKVAEQYLQNCNKIWIVAPIKRAVDDGTAKELLGAQFKRRLLMDGQYGNCSFICTQTDDCEPTEIMRDHADVAQLVEGRWDKMTSLSDEITSIEDSASKLFQQEEDLQDELHDAVQARKEKEIELAELNDELSCDDTQANFNYLALELNKLQKELDNALHFEQTKQKQLSDWRESNKSYMDDMQAKCETAQRSLKTLCAQVRNEYSTKCLQSDFRAGLKELYSESRGVDEDQDNNTSTEQITALPEDFELDVFCISSNDYLKIEGIKPKSDGASNTFFDAEDTQIPRLRSFVHETTAHTISSFTKAFVHHSSDIYDRIKLLATDAANVPRGRTSLQCMRIFEQEINKISQQILPLTKEFSVKMHQKVKTSLEPALEIGAKNGTTAALPICESWGSKSRRSSHHRDPLHNGLYWATYQATVRRDGVFTSHSAGSIDMNQELCDPMEKEFSVDWQRTLDSALRLHLGEAESKVQEICSSVNNTITSAFEKEGMDKTRLKSMNSTASRGCMNAVRAAFASMHFVAINTQRNLNRSLLPLVQQQMKKSYSAAYSVERGKGVFDRMKHAMLKTTKVVVDNMFNESKITLLRGIQGMVNQLVDLIQKTDHTIRKHLEDVYSICWDDQRETQKIIDPAMKQKIRECRDALLPNLNKLRDDLVAAQELVGIEREAPELDVMAVDSLDMTIQRKIHDAEARGEIIDLCDSDDEDDELMRLAPYKPYNNRVKAEMQDPY